MTQCKWHETRLSQAERTLSAATDVSHSIDKLAGALSALEHIQDREHALRAPKSMRIIRKMFSRVLIRIGTQATFNIFTGDARPSMISDQLPLDQWEFLAQQSARLVGVSEQALALEFYDIALQMLTYAIDSLARIGLEAEGVIEAQKPYSTAKKASRAH